MLEKNKNIKINGGLSQAIPDSVNEVFNAEDTAFQISKICLENNLSKEEDIENIGYGIGLVLLGQLPPHNLPTFLEKAFKINNKTAQEIYKRVDETIFSRVKDDLSKIYESKSTGQEPGLEAPEKLRKPPSKDIYREPAE